MINEINEMKLENLIIMSGCGTSGRIAYYCARQFNRFLKSIGVTPCFGYLISGKSQTKNLDFFFF